MTGRKAVIPIFLIIVALLSPSVHAGWEEVTALDAPAALSADPAKAQKAMTLRLQSQITANESFLKQSPDDPHADESRIRLASAQGRLASLTADQEGVQRAVTRLRDLERTLPEENLKAEAMFRRISLQWQNLGDTPDLRRENSRNLALQFAAAFPEDRRSPRLLTEAAALSNSHPSDKASLLSKASELCKEEPLRKRISDEMLQLDQLGKPVDLSFTSIDGSKVDLAADQGKVTAVVFWSAESAPSLVWMRYFAKFAENIPSLRVVTVSLDRNREDLDAAMKSLRLNWPTHCDGKGWDKSIARRFGINTLPTLWLLDRQGRLTGINARDSYELKINELLLRK